MIKWIKKDAAKRQRRDSGYQQLKTKLLFVTIFTMVTAVMLVIALYMFIFRGHFANAVVGFLSNFIYAKYEDAYDRAYTTYHLVVRQYISWYFVAGMVAVFVIAQVIYLNSFIRYFVEINRGIDALLTENTGDVILPQELATTERKINSIKHTLEQRKSDAQLAEQRKNDLIVYLAHDLKTPLTSVIGYLTLLRDEPQISQELRCRYTGIALEKAERLEDLINEFFDITRFNLTTLTLEKEQIHLSRMLEQIASESVPVLEEHELQWRLEIAPDIEIWGDADKLARVLDNLIRNAVSYSYAGTEILLFAQTEKDMVKIMVKNHGRTIAPDKLEHIFEQFYRADAARSSATGGAGLGLAIAKEIVELHGGTITAASANGCTILIVTLPCKTGLPC
ncbi:MAG: HAMP domain-containing histidine kinase [Lachnospiraceae bacterium]|nr:HAMP domain-containing histidine kinase [Lachnospiraceae bacterium]